MTRITLLALGCFTLSLLAGCQSTQSKQVSTEPYLLDSSFTNYHEVNIESREQIFALNDDARRFVARKLGHVKEPRAKMKKLMRLIFDRADMHLFYESDANTTASETFNNRIANCLSMSILTYALAKEAGLSAAFQEVDIPEYWTRRNGFSFINGHINVKLTPPESIEQYYFDSIGVIVDFYPLVRQQRFPQSRTSVDRVVSMFYNNKGAEALISNDYKKAYAYFRAAIMSDKEFQSPWINLAGLYRMTQHYDWAEKTYQEAIKIDRNNLTAWENLAVLYVRTGHHEKAADIKASLERKRERNPYYHYIVGEELRDRGKYRAAISAYKQATRLDPNKHQFYFGLAKAYYQLGDKSTSRRFMKKAMRRAEYQDEREKYQGKLDVLAGL